MPEKVEACVRSVLDDNPDMDEDRAWAICKSQEQEGNLEDGAELADGCPQGEVNINGGCVAVESVDAPPSLLSGPMHLTLEKLDTKPIERIQEDDNTVRYTSIRLLAPGVWADAGSQTETYYPPEGVANLEAHYDESKYDGPPLNIMHDLDVDAWEPHEASVAGHIDPETLDTDDDGNMYADLVFDTSKGAGQYADENLKSTLENEGTVGFGGPSVEIPAEGLQQSHDEVRDMPRVDGGRLTGASMVFDPASKSVNFAREAARRPIAMGSGSPKAKVLTRQSGGMSQHKKIRDALLSRQLQVGDIQDDAENIADELGVPIDEVMAVLDPLMDPPEEDEDGGEEMQEEEEDEFPDEEEEEEEEEEQEMQDDEPDDPVDALQEQVQNLSSRLEDLEDAVAQAMTAEDVDAELEDAAGQKLADMDTVKELEDAKEELDRRLEALESRGKESKTLADAGGSGVDYSDADSGIDFDPATGSMSR